MFYLHIMTCYENFF